MSMEVPYPGDAGYDDPPLNREKVFQRSSDYWFSRTPSERIAAVELMRQIKYGYEAATGRMKRIMQFCQRTETGEVIVFSTLNFEKQA